MVADSIAADLCISPAAEPMDRQSSMIIVKTPIANKVRVFRRICHSWREAGNRDRAAFHEYVFSASMAKGGAPAGSFSSPRNCDIRMEELLSRMPFVSPLSRWVCIGGDEDGDGGSEASLKVGQNCDG